MKLTVAGRMMTVLFVVAIFVTAMALTTCTLAGEPSGSGLADLPLAQTPPVRYEVLGKQYEVLSSSLGYREIGIASWYGKKFHGRLTSLGETYDMHGISAAHKSLPLPTTVKVTNLDSGKSTVLRVNDRGPFHDDRLIDLSYGAAKALDFQTKGTVPVVVEALDAVNYPHLAAPEAGVGKIYLQLGAFSVRASAENYLSQVRRALPEQIGIRILQSESEQRVLYKIWAGPVTDGAEEQQVAAIIARNNLGKTLRVKLD